MGENPKRGAILSCDTRANPIPHPNPNLQPCACELPCGIEVYRSPVYV